MSNIDIEDFGEAIDRILDMKLGYTSKEDFVREAIRKRIQEVRYPMRQQQISIHRRLLKIEKMVASIRRRI